MSKIYLGLLRKLTVLKNSVYFWLSTLCKGSNDECIEAKYLVAQTGSKLTEGEQNLQKEAVRISPEDNYGLPTKVRELRKEEVRDRQKTIAQMKASRTETKLSLDDLLRKSSSELFEEIKLKDRFDRYVEMFSWKEKLEREYARISTAAYRDEGRREKGKKCIRSKIEDIDWYVSTGEAGEARRKLKPLQRKASEGLILIYELLEEENVQYYDELSGLQAWGLIVSQEFTSDLIESIPTTKAGSLLLKGGERLNQSDFCEKYRKRFL